MGTPQLIVGFVHRVPRCAETAVMYTSNLDFAQLSLYAYDIIGIRIIVVHMTLGDEQKLVYVRAAAGAASGDSPHCAEQSPAGCHGHGHAIKIHMPEAAPFPGIYTVIKA